MSTLTNTQLVIARQGEALDALCWRIYGKAMKGSRVVEEVLLLNHGLADKGDILPHGTAVLLPNLPTTATRKETVQLWN